MLAEALKPSSSTKEFGSDETCMRVDMLSLKIGGQLLHSLEGPRCACKRREVGSLASQSSRFLYTVVKLLVNKDSRTQPLVAA